MAKGKRKGDTYNDDMESYVYGKVPPQAREIEKAILGIIMLQGNAIDMVIDRLRPEVFYLEAHQHIFKAMMQLTHKSQPIDILTVSDELRTMGLLELVGDAYYITQLTNSVVSSAHLESHARIIFQKFIQRQLINLGGHLINDGYEDRTDVFEMLDKAEKGLWEVTNSLYKKSYSGTDTLLVKAQKEIWALSERQEELSGVTSGFPSVDRLTHGWQDTDLIILAARPAVGKTALALNLARNAAMAGTPVAFFSLEMSSGQLIRRLMSAESEIPLNNIQRGRLEDADKRGLFAKGIVPLAKAPIFIDDTAGLNVFELRAKCRRLKIKEGIGIIFIDYLQLMSGVGSNNKQNREQEISEISRNLKGLAKELNVPIIALSQLSRETEKRANKKPMLSDLRESGAIEQDADAVIFIYRPEYYGIHRDASGESNVGETHLDFAKYRNGSPGTVKLKAQLWIQKFIEMEEEIKNPSKKPGGVDYSKKTDEPITPVWKPIQIDLQDNTFNNETN